MKDPRLYYNCICGCCISYEENRCECKTSPYFNTIVSYEGTCKRYLSLTKHAIRKRKRTKKITTIYDLEN